MPRPEDLQVLELAPDGSIQTAQWLARAEPVHRQLRPHLSDYPATIARVLAGGAHMLLAVRGEAVLGVTVFRLFPDTANGLRCYVDDLVTDEAARGQGVGHLLLQTIAERARLAGAATLTLDSGTQRCGAHAFYFREGFVIPSFAFRKPL